MLAKLTAGVLLSAGLVGGITAYTGVLLVDVDAADGPRIVMPVPLAVARAGLAVAPDHVEWAAAPELSEHLPDLREAARALRDAGDATLVEVVDGEEHVRLTTEDGLLRIRVVDGSATTAEMARTAEVTVPLASLESALEAYDLEKRAFRTSRLVAALAEAPRGDLVRLADRGDNVRVRRIF